MIREYKDGDEEGIMKLFSLIWPEQSSRVYWKWMNTLCPFGKTLIQIAEKKKDIIVIL